MPLSHCSDMQLEPRLFVEVVDAQDTKVVLPDAATELVKLDAGGHAKHGADDDDAVTKVCSDGARI